MTRPREIPWDPTLGVVVRRDQRTGDWAHADGHRPPSGTILEALMVCPPNAPPALSLQELLPVRELIQNAIDRLGELEHYVFDAVFVQRMSLRAIDAETTALEAAGLGVRLPRTSAARVRDRAVVQLRLELEQEPLVVEMLKA